MKPVVTELKMTCTACPSQWEGKTQDGRFVYIRYRWSTLWAGIGSTPNAAVTAAFVRSGVKWRNPSVDEWNGMHGEMSTETMIEKLVDVFDFNLQEGTIRKVLG